MNLLEYLGNFHPLAIHLPIGILAVFLAMAIFLSKEILLNAVKIVRLVLLVSAFGATTSVLTGYVLSNSDSYDVQLVLFHQWSGIILTLINWLLYFKIEFLLKTSSIIYRAVLVFVLIGLIITGHAGGSLTHGSDFINPPPVRQWFSAENTIKKIDLNSTVFEATSIIFEKKCNVCHGDNKQKGELRLDTKGGILAGGENGKLIAKNATESLLMQRLKLPMDDKKHMPPKEKSQLTKTEIAFIHWWLNSGAEFDKTLAELQLPDSLMDILYKENKPIVDPTIPEKEITAADEILIEDLRQLQVKVMPLSENANYLSANFINVLEENSAESIKLLAGISSQLIWLNLDYQKLNDEIWQELQHLTSLRKLSLRGSNLSNKNLNNIGVLNDIVHLNLVGTDINSQGLAQIKNLQNLQMLYLFGNDIEPLSVDSIQNWFPKTQIDIGQYIVPTLESDTTVLTLKSLSKD